MMTEQNSKVVPSSKNREGSFVTPRVPAGWDICEFSKVFDFISTNSYSRELMSYEVRPTSYFNIHYGDIHATFTQQILDFKKHESQVPVLINAPKNVNGDSLLRDGDLVIADASEDYEGVGECIEIANIDGRRVLSGLHTIAARDKTGRTYEGFRAYLLHHPQVSVNLKRIATGSKVYGISKTNIAVLRLALPPLAEQRKIALILSTWDRAIEKTEQLIAQKQQLKKGLMQQLLTGKVRFKEFVKSKKMKKTKLGMVPEDWQVKRVKDYGKVVTGNTPSTNDESYYGNEFLFAGPLDLGKGKYIRKTEKRLSYKGFNISRKFPAGAVMFTCIGSTIGKMGIATTQMTSNQQINAIFCKRGQSNEFLYYELSWLSSRIKLLAGEQAVPIINKTQFENIAVVMPPFFEQDAISRLLKSVDREIETGKAKMDNLKSLKKGLMQQLLTGKVRVKISTI